MHCQYNYSRTSSTAVQYNYSRTSSTAVQYNYSRTSSTAVQTYQVALRGMLQLSLELSVQYQLSI